MIPLNENHFPNTAYLNGIGQPVKIFTLPYYYSASILVGMTSPIKARKYKFVPSSFSHVITLQFYLSADLDFYLKLLKLIKAATFAK